MALRNIIVKHKKENMNGINENKGRKIQLNEHPPFYFPSFEI
jgi:hypothetical protein